ncbi:YqgE/AlgH family protein [soil metagenome]
MESARYLTGQFLFAMPGIGDPRFERSVIAICAHDRQGAIGIGVGAVVDGLTLHDLLEQFDIEPGEAPDVPVHFGGPVEVRRGFVLHSNDWGGQDTILVAGPGGGDVAGRWSMTGTVDVLRAIAAGNGPSRFVVSLGYAGWEAGQLDEELTRHGWFHAPGDIGLLFDTDASERWERGFAGAGIDPRLLSGQAGRA